MPTRRRLLAAGVATAFAGCASPDFDYSDGGSAGEDASPQATEADTGTDTAPGHSTALSSSAFEDGGSVPQRFTADGVNVSPPLAVDALPEETTVYALLMEDLDVEDAPFTHWLVWNVSPGIEEVPAGIPPQEEVDTLGDARQGTNDFGTVGYMGPDPPASDPPHSYRFALLALEEGLSLPAGAERSAFDDAVDGVVAGRADLVATYVR